MQNALPGPPLGSVAVSAGYLLTLLPMMCRGSLSLAENGPLMAPADWGAEEAEVAEVSRPLASTPLAIATLLEVLGLVVHSLAPLMTTDYLAWAGACQPLVSGTIYLSSLGLAVVYGPRGCSVYPSYPG